jgi:hypothetical protein
MTTTAGHSFYIGPIGFFYNQVNDTGSWEPLVFCHNKLTRQILYVVIYFFCNVFLTIHTLVYVITFVLCHHLYLDVCVCPQVLNLSKLPVYYCIKFLTESYKLWSFFFVAFFIQQKIYPKHVFAFVGIVLAET